MLANLKMILNILLPGSGRWFNPTPVQSTLVGGLLQEKFKVKVITGKKELEAAGEISKGISCKVANYNNEYIIPSFICNLSCKEYIGIGAIHRLVAMN